MMTIFFALILHWYLSLFFQTIFLHRYASHNMFKMTPFVEKVFYFLTFLFQGSSFLHPAAYGVMHKRHHALSFHNPNTPELHTNSLTQHQSS